MTEARKPKSINSISKHEVDLVRIEVNSIHFSERHVVLFSRKREEEERGGWKSSSSFANSLLWDYRAILKTRRAVCKMQLRREKKVLTHWPTSDTIYFRRSCAVKRVWLCSRIRSLERPSLWREVSVALQVSFVKTDCFPTNKLFGEHY